MRSLKTVVVCCAAGLLGFVPSALGSLYTFGSPIRAVNPSDPLGLLENVYHLSSAFDANTSTPPTNAAIDAFVTYAATHVPNYSFVNTNTGFHWVTGNDDSQTKTILGADGAGAGATDSAGLRTTIIDGIGGIRVPVPGTYTFAISGADDAARIYIGNSNSTPGTGTDVAELNYDGSVTTTPGTVNFTAAGVYSIEVFWFNQAVKLGGTTGGAGFTLDVTPPGGSTLSYTTAVPEPAAIALIALASVSLRFKRRRA